VNNFAVVDNQAFRIEIVISKDQSQNYQALCCFYEPKISEAFQIVFDELFPQLDPLYQN
jgi:hypothetical protein